MLSEHSTEWLGYPVELYDPNERKTPDFRHKIYRITSEYDGPALTEVFTRFLAYPESRETHAIIFGRFGGDDMETTCAPLVEKLVSVSGRLPNLRGIFIGDILSEECEISWINQSDVSPLFRAYPKLEHFRIRGTNGLTLGEIHHARLKSLVIESGGLDVDVLRDAVSEDLPALEHLEIWLGSENYGGNVSLEGLEPVLSGRKFPPVEVPRPARQRIAGRNRRGCGGFTDPVPAGNARLFPGHAHGRRRLGPADERSLPRVEED